MSGMRLYAISIWGIHLASVWGGWSDGGRSMYAGVALLTVKVEVSIR